MEEKLVCIGQVLSSHGVKGEVKVFPYTDYPERCYRLEEVKVGEDSAGECLLMKVQKARFHGKLWLLKFEGVEDKGAADGLRGKYLYIAPHERVALPEGHYYYDQITGLQVYTMEGVYLGVVQDIIPAGGQDTYVVSGDGSGKNYLIPAVRQMITEINLEKQRITVDPPEGLLEL